MPSSGIIMEAASNPSEDDASMADAPSSEGGSSVRPSEGARLADFSWRCQGQSNVGIYAIAALASPGRLVAAGGDEQVHVLQLNFEEVNVNEAEEIEGVIDEIPQTLPKCYSDSIAAMILSGDKTCLAVGALGGSVVAYSVDKNGNLAVLKIHDNVGADVEALDFAPSSKALLGAAADGTAYVWHAAKGWVSQFSGHRGRVTACRFASARNRAYCLTVGVDGKLCVWHPETGVCQHTITVVEVDPALTADQLSDPDFPPTGISCIDIGPDQAVVACGCADGRVAIVNFENGSVLKYLPSVEANIECLQFSPVRTRELYGDIYLAAGDSEGKCSVTTLSSDSWRRQIPLTSNDSAISHLQWRDTVSGVRLIAAATDGLIREVDPRNSQILTILDTREESICCLELVNWASNLACLVVGTEEGSVYLWSLE